MNEYWHKTHQIYSKKDWINKTSIFAKFVLGYLPEKGNLLDMGAGQGQDSIFFASRGYNVVSADISELALQLAGEKTAKKDLNIKFKKLDIADKLPFPDCSFDIVYSHLALHYFTDEKTKEVFSEIFRVLNPGGILACLLNTVDDPELSDPGFEKVDQNYYKDPDGLLKRYFSVDYLQGIIKDLFAPVVLDNKGETYKDEIRSLIRFVGKAVKPFCANEIKL